MNVTVTKHGAMRMRKRMGISKHSVERMAERVYEQGTRYADTKGRLHKYLEKVEERNDIENELIVHGNNLYIYRENHLITVWPLPGILPAS